MADNRFRNWQNAVDIDYLSLYIKTWFAFLGTVQELHPEAINGNGDGSLINVYKDNVGIPVKFGDVMIPHIEKLYSIGNESLKRDVPQSYFVNFYNIDKNFRLEIENLLTTYKTIDGVREYDKSFIRLEYRDNLDGVSNPNIFITIKSNSRKFNENLNCHHHCLNLPLSDFIDNMDEGGGDRIFKSKDSCIALVESKLQNSLHMLVESIEALEVDAIEERKGYCNGLQIPLITLLRQNFDIEQIFSSLPLQYFPENYNVEGNQRKILNWFISFNYQIRNLLFHSIIDPFHAEWLKLFKHAYLALKELVEHNIEKIEQEATT